MWRLLLKRTRKILTPIQKVTRGKELSPVLLREGKTTWSRKINAESNGKRHRFRWDWNLSHRRLSSLKMAGLATSVRTTTFRTGIRVIAARKWRSRTTGSGFQSTWKCSNQMDFRNFKLTKKTAVQILSQKGKILTHLQKKTVVRNSILVFLSLRLLSSQVRT